MRKFAKKVVVVAVSAVIAVASAGMAFGNNYARKNCPKCEGRLETSYGTLQMWSEVVPCDHGYADQGVKDTVYYRHPVFRYDCPNCGYFEDYPMMDVTEEMSRICGRTR